MANEITVITGLSGAKNGMNIASGTRSKQRTMNGSNMVAESQLINGTSGSGTQIDITALANISEILIYNRDNTAAINVSAYSNMASPLTQVKPNTAVILQPPGNTNTLYALSQNASSVNIAFYAAED